MPYMARYRIEAPYTEIKWIVRVNQRHGAIVESSESADSIRQTVIIASTVTDAWVREMLAGGLGRITLTPVETDSAG